MTKLVPKYTQPLTKAVRTLEGVVLGLAAAVPWAVSIINPSTLSAPEAAKWSAISATALGVSRTALKIGAVLKGAGVAPDPVDLDVLAEKLAAKIGIDKLPTTDDLRAAISDAKKDISDPAALLQQIDAALQPSPAEQSAEPPAPAPVIPAPQPVVPVGG